MTLSCPTCHASLTIPDERLPRGKLIGASCPHCKGRVTIDTTASASAPAPPPDATPPAPAPAPEPAPPGYREEERPAALICVGAPAEREAIAAAMRQEGYRVETAGDPAETIQRLRFTAYALVILREGFGSAKGDANPVLDHLADMPMAARRDMAVLLVSTTLRSHDPAAAFARSVTLVLHVNDLPHLAAAVKRSRAEADETYSVFLESLRSAGKA
jgi:CheY-like chemotaxis protein